MKKLIDEICQAEQIQTTWFSHDWLVRLERDEKQHFIYGYTFELNPAAVAAIANDKCATYDMLKFHHLPTIEYQLFYEESNPAPYVAGRQGLAYLKHFFQAHGQHIVIKPNNGTGGRNVYELADLSDAPAMLERVFHQSFAAALCPFYDIKHEYRAIVLDDEVRLVYQKTRGDDWRFNLAMGAQAEPIADQQLRVTISALARRAAQALSLRFASIDIIETTEDELLIIEANSGVTTEHYLQQHPEDYDLIKAIYRDAIRTMFASEG